MKDLFTEEFDVDLKTQLPHLANYPIMLPFIGREWKNSRSKILLLGESHFIPGDEWTTYKGEGFITDWYSNNTEGVYTELANHLNTRNVVKIADEKQGKHINTLSLYYNAKTAIKQHYPHYKDEPLIFPYLSFYNYFQKPSFKIGKSVQNNKMDNDIAYQTLKVVTSFIKPEKIIFCSKRAWNAFAGSLSTADKETVFNNIVIDYTCHPGSVYWNKKVKSYGNRTGRMKFDDILKR